MAKAKSKAIIMAADGAGGMAQVQDRRFRHVNERSASRVTQQFHRGWQLCYDGLPWRGELWLDDTLRLGPPSLQDETALLGPRVIIVDAFVDSVGRRDSVHVL